MFKKFGEATYDSKVQEIEAGMQVFEHVVILETEK